MLVSEFIKRKNAIIFEYTGVILVPEDQITECEQKPLRLAETEPEEDDTEVCPYCMVYYETYVTEDCETVCEGCPMHEADNNCNNLNNSSYREVTAVLKDKYNCWGVSAINAPYRDELKALVDEYNEELGNVDKY